MVETVRDGLGNVLLRDQAEYRQPNATQPIMRAGFATAVGAGWNARLWEQKGPLGVGMGANQASSNGNITTGTTANSEVIMRSRKSFTGPKTLRYALALTQRIVNQNFFVELVDVIGDDLPFTTNAGGTQVTVTKAGHGFTNGNVGQGMNLGNVQTPGTDIPGRYVIASVPDANTLVFTVAGWGASIAGTLSLFGWNYHRITYDGTVATAAKIDSQNNGWNSADTTVTVNSTAAPGHIGLLNDEDGCITYGDQLAASTATAPQVTVRGTRNVNIPSNATPLYLQIRVQNGSVAPASTTTLSLPFIQVEDYVVQQVSLTGARFGSINHAIPVAVVSSSAAPAAAPTVITGQSIPTVSATANQGPTLLTHKRIAAATTNATVVKATAGRLVGGSVTNVSAGIKFLKLYNKATAPTVGTDVPVLTIPIPAGANVPLVPILSEKALQFATGIGYALTGAVADADTTVLAAGDVITNLLYI